MRITQRFYARIASGTVEKRLHDLTPLDKRCRAQLSKLGSAVSTREASENDGGFSVFSWPADLDPAKEHERGEILRKAMEPVVTAHHKKLWEMMIEENKTASQNRTGV